MKSIALTSPPLHSSTCACKRRCARWGPFRKRVWTRAATGTASSIDTLSKWAEASVDGFPQSAQLLQERDKVIMVAKETLKAKTRIASIPKMLWIDLEVVKKSKIGSLVGNLEPWLQLSLFILLEREKNDSDWRSFLITLPDDLSSPAFWPEEKLQTINGSQLHEAASGYRVFFRQKYDELTETVFRQDPDLFDIGLFNFDAFCWAVGIVRSHLFPPLDKNQSLLLPFVSYIRHSREANVELQLESGTLLRRSPSYVVTALEEITPGNALLMNYGPDKLDNQIALEYGAFDAAHPREGYKLTLGIPDDDKFRDDKLDVLEVCGLEESPSFELFLNEEPSENLLLFLRLLNLSGIDAFHLEAIFRGEIEYHLIEPISQENEQKMCDTMISGCQAALDSYKSIPRTSASENEAEIYQVCNLIFFLSSDGVNQNRRDNLEKLEYYADQRLKNLGLLDDEGKSTFEDMWKGGIA